MTTVLTPWAEVFQRILAADRTTRFGAECGIVQSFDSSAQTVDVQIANRQVLPAAEEEDADVLEELPILNNVPVAYQRNSSFSVYFPLSAGDLVLVVFCDQDRNAWRTSGDVSDPLTTERNGLGGASRSLVCSPLRALSVVGLCPASAPTGAPPLTGSPERSGPAGLWP